MISATSQKIKRSGHNLLMERTVRQWTGVRMEEKYIEVSSLLKDWPRALGAYCSPWRMTNVIFLLRPNPNLNLSCTTANCTGVFFSFSATTPFTHRKAAVVVRASDPWARDFTSSQSVHTARANSCYISGDSRLHSVKVRQEQKYNSAYFLRPTRARLNSGFLKVNRVIKINLSLLHSVY